MKVQELPKFILSFLFIGMLVGVGIIIFVNTGDSARDTLTATDENHTFFTLSDTALDQTEVRDITSVENASNTLTVVTDYNVTIGTSATNIRVHSNYNNTQLNVTYRYYSDTEATTQFDNLTTAISAITTTWIGLIITILMLAIILAFVLNSFNPR